MNAEATKRDNLFYRGLLALAILALAAALRVAPHPWNFTPVGAMALFSGAVVRDRRWAFLFPLLALFAGDQVGGLYQVGVLLFVYLSFSVSVLIGRFLRGHRTILRMAAATFLGSVQFFLISNFAVWWLLDSYPRTGAGLAACYLRGLPLFGNTLAGDAFYVALFFGAFALAERLLPVLREPAPVAIR